MRLFALIFKDIDIERFNNSEKLVEIDNEIELKSNINSSKLF